MPLNLFLRSSKAEGQEGTSVSFEGGSWLTAVFLVWDAYLGPTLSYCVSERNRKLYDIGYDSSSNIDIYFFIGL